MREDEGASVIDVLRHTKKHSCSQASFRKAVRVRDETRDKLCVRVYSPGRGRVRGVTALSGDSACSLFHVSDRSVALSGDNLIDMHPRIRVICGQHGS